MLVAIESLSFNNDVQVNQLPPTNDPGSSNKVDGDQSNSIEPLVSEAAGNYSPPFSMNSVINLRGSGEIKTLAANPESSSATSETTKPWNAEHPEHKNYPGWTNEMDLTVMRDGKQEIYQVVVMPDDPKTANTNESFSKYAIIGPDNKPLIDPKTNKPYELVISEGNPNQRAISAGRQLFADLHNIVGGAFPEIHRGSDLPAPAK